ncbi:UNKNOWN [Stylonychia lemnae]|uniref:Uncharacterized protein n=1 Tax=Stylonychia lemnae TaxID=5949 RepID=A0A078AWV3_STYLE|nr:UNKNOWN [Stylonychia lemnae]|eukprot:CDW86536.1 UNKNOWN [Stylonychia lemnae]
MENSSIFNLKLKKYPCENKCREEAIYYCSKKCNGQHYYCQNCAKEVHHDHTPYERERVCDQLIQKEKAELQGRIDELESCLLMQKPEVIVLSNFFGKVKLKIDGQQSQIIQRSGQNNIDQQMSLSEQGRQIVKLKQKIDLYFIQLSYYQEELGVVEINYLIYSLGQKIRDRLVRLREYKVWTYEDIYRAFSDIIMLDFEDSDLIQEQSQFDQKTWNIYYSFKFKAQNRKFEDQERTILQQQKRIQNLENENRKLEYLENKSQLLEDTLQELKQVILDQYRANS